MMITRFRDREDAGRMLAAKLTAYADRPNVLVLALPRGGVPVAYAVAQRLHAPLDVFVVRKLGSPGQEELAMGAIATGGVRVLNHEVIRALGISEKEIEEEVAKELLELERRESIYRDGRPAPDLSGRTVILVDDGIATGSTMRAAVAALRKEGVGRIVIAVAVAPSSTCEKLQGEVDEVVCVLKPELFFAIGSWYEDFSQTTDEQVHDLLKRATQAYSTAAQ